MKKTITVILVIAILLFVATFALDGVARRNEQKEHVWLMKMLLPGSSDFKLLNYAGDDSNIRSVHQADEGFVIETVTQGYVDEITMYIGVDNQGIVTGLVTLDAHETVGLGSGILTNHEFLAQFLDETGTFSIGTGISGEEMYIDGISGATVSSKAVARCVNSAVSYVTGTDIDSSATSWGG